MEKIQKFKQKNSRYEKQNWWIDIYLENGKIVTAFEMDAKEYQDILLKGDLDTFEIIDVKIKEIENARKS